MYQRLSAQDDRDLGPHSKFFRQIGPKLRERIANAFLWVVYDDLYPY